MPLSSVVVIRRAEPEVKPEVAQATGYTSFLEVNQQTESTFLQAHSSWVLFPSPTSHLSLCLPVGAARIIIRSLQFFPTTF